MATSKTDILNEMLIKALSATGNMIDKAVDVVQQQAPLLVSELLTWYATYSAVLFTISVICFISAVVAFKKFWKFSEKFGPDDMYFSRGLSMFVTGVALFVTGAATLSNLDWLKILIAPRLWLIEYAANLVK